MKIILRTLAVLMIILLLSVPTSLAELARGDRGENVEYLQSLLREGGWLMDNVDGVFGKNTQQAVMDFENWLGLPADGVAQDEIIHLLEASLRPNEDMPVRPLTEIAMQEGPVRLNGSTIIDGNTIYYAGAIDGNNDCICTMDANGSNVQKFADLETVLIAESGGNLLVCVFDWNNDYYGIELLRADGVRFPVSEYGVYRAIAADGYFYFGPLSIAQDGGMIKTIIPCEPELYGCIWPMEISDGWLYYLDSRETDERAYSEGGILPPGAELLRAELESGRIEKLSGIGTSYIGVENGFAYYCRRNYYMFNDAYDLDEVQVDEGLFRLDLATGEESRLAQLPHNDFLFLNYHTLYNGVIYGECADYTLESNVNSIIRMRTDGTKLPNIRIDSGDSSVSFLTIVDGMYFSGEIESFEDAEGNYRSREYILATDLESGKSQRLMVPQRMSLFYTEQPANIAVANGQIYFHAYDEAAEQESFMSISLDGLKANILAQGNSY